MSSSDSESSTNTTVNELPFNAENILMPKDIIISFLKTYGIQQTPKDFTLYQKSMVHKSYCTRKNENAVTGNLECPPGTLPLQE